MNILKSIFIYKCPSCRKGDLFVKPLDIKDPLAMNERCEVCDQKTEPEPGFYFGAMFISYIISAFIFLFIAAICIIYFDFSGNGAMGVVLLFAVVFYLKILRISRSIWIHAVVKYKPLKNL